MRGADSNEGLPAATLDGACAPPRQPSNAHPHAAVQEMSDLLDADLGRPALEVLTRLCDQGVRPAVLVYIDETRAPRQTRATQVNPTALAAVVRELRKERDALAAAASQAGGEAPRR